MATSEHLERLLKRAVQEPGTRPRFLKKLLMSNAFVFIHHPADEMQTVWNSQTVAWIRNDGAEVIPIFTSQEALAKAPLPGSTAFNVHVQSLLEANPNTHCHVNPGSLYEMLFAADELASTLDIIARAGGSTTLMAGARENAAIATSHPVLTGRLVDFLTAIGQVEQAYFLEVELTQSPVRPLQIAILVTEIVHVTEAISKVVEGTYGRKQSVKVRLLLQGTPEYQSVKTAGIAPFYDREWSERLLALKPSALS